MNMDPAAFKDDFPGTLNADQGYLTYQPDPLPPEINLTQELVGKLGEARGAIGKLAGIGQTIQESRMLLLGPFIRREAVYSSRIEGTYATVSSVYAHEVGEEALDDASSAEVREVLNYVEATEKGLSQISDIDLNHEFLKSLHEILMTNVRGEEKNPGEYGTEQRTIGHRDPHKARYVPTAPHRIKYEMDELFEFIKQGSQYDPLIDIALAHYQFETIHPFADGNGRMGRLLITLMLDKYDLLPVPFLYFSSYFNKYRDEYVDKLFGVNSRGDWGSWMSFFLDGVIDQSKEVFIRSRKLFQRRSDYREMYQDRRSEALLSIVFDLFRRPVITIKQAEEVTDVKYHATRDAVYELEDDGILTEITGKSRYKVFRADEIMEIIEQPIEDLVSDVDEEFNKHEPTQSLEPGQAALGDFV